jgi:hypothetical protein
MQALTSIICPIYLYYAHKVYLKHTIHILISHIYIFGVLDPRSIGSLLSYFAIFKLVTAFSLTPEMHNSDDNSETATNAVTMGDRYV